MIQQTAAAKPLLSITIPTFNRVECVSLLVDRLLEDLSQIPDAPSLVEIVVVNNASTDGTRDYLDELSRRSPCRVVHNDSNLGMDGNFVRCFQVATGKWLWLCSDDDLPMIGALRTIVDELRRTDCTMVYLPTAFHAGSLAGSTARAPAQAIQVENEAQFAVRVNGLFTFITCIIADRESFLAAVPDPDLTTLRDTFFVFFEWEFELLKRGRRFGYFPQPMMLARAENSRGYDFARVFTERFNRACEVKLADRPELRDLIIDGMRFRHLPHLFYRTRIGRNGAFNFDAAQASADYRSTYGAGLYYLLVMYPIFALPPVIAKAALFLGKVWGKFWFEWTARVSAR